MQVATGQYTGDGTTTGRAITGVGFQPDIVIIKGNASGSNSQQYWTTSAMKTVLAGLAKAMDGNSADTASINSLDSDGFTVAVTSAIRTNVLGTLYDFICFKADANNLATGTYTGNGADDRSITGVGFQPDLVFIQGLTLGSQETFFRHQSDATDVSHSFVGTADAADRIQAFGADGFQIGTLANVNTGSYHWVALKAESGVFGQGTYSGDGNDDRGITGVGFQPDFVIIKNDTTSTQKAVCVTNTTTSGNSHYFDTTADATNKIQALQSDGFQVGTGAEVNTSGDTYLWMAWKRTTTGSVVTRLASPTRASSGERTASNNRSTASGRLTV